jgi:hypothetical protein
MPKTIPLYQQPIRIPDGRMAPLSKAVVLVGGINGSPQNFNPQHMGLKPHDRISGGQRKQPHNVKTNIALTSGKTDASKRGINQHHCYSAKEYRAMAVSVLRGRGIKPTEAAIAGILTGRTL